ncbi:MAG: SAM-dependent methyltransferase [Pseudomonadota bacterium]
MSASLPEPDEQERLYSGRLVEVIRHVIEANSGAIDFSRFMAAALYTPGLGYYTGGRQKFGPGGDFITAPELGDVFARLLARPCADILEVIGNGNLLEAGAGSGRLAATLLTELERLGRLPEHYYILDVSSELRARQAELLKRVVPSLAGRVEWLSELPKRFRGVVLANELLDALPVERFCIQNKEVRQQQVALKKNQLIWAERPADEVIRARIAPLSLPDGYCSEIGLAAEAWTRSIADVLEQGVALFIDYGFPRAEFYHPQRTTGTLMCHYRQRAHGDPLILAGLQDITAHVDFTAIAAAGTGTGLDLLGYTSQAAFLIGCGLEDIMADPAMPDATRLRLANEINRLTSPAEMGELFKVMVLGRGIENPLRGTGRQDRRGRL